MEMIFLTGVFLFGSFLLLHKAGGTKPELISVGGYRLRISALPDLMFGLERKTVAGDALFLSACLQIITRGGLKR